MDLPACAVIAVNSAVVWLLPLQIVAMAGVEGRLLADLAELQSISDSSEYAASRDIQHNQLVGVIKSLLAAGLVEGEVC